MAGPETVTLIRRGEPTGTDAYNQPTYGPPTEVAIDLAFVEPAGSDEPDEADRQPVLTRANVYVPASARAQLGTAPFDGVRIRGEVFEIVGQPADWSSGWTSWDPGIVLTCLRVAG